MAARQFFQRKKACPQLHQPQPIEIPQQFALSLAQAGTCHGGLGIGLVGSALVGMTQADQESIQAHAARTGGQIEGIGAGQLLDALELRVGGRRFVNAGGVGLGVGLARLIMHGPVPS